MKSLFNFGSSNVNIHFTLTDADTKPRKKLPILGGASGTEELPLYSGLDPITGTVHVDPMGKKLEHQGIKIEAIGQIELYADKDRAPKDKIKFSYIVREIRAPGTMFSAETHPFEFNTERVNETYRGRCISIRYFLRLTVSRSTIQGGNFVQEIDIAMENPPDPVANSSITDGTEEGIKMEVGIEDCLHIEFEFDKSKYSIKDVILGKIHFVLVRIKIKHMELAVLRRENAQAGANVFNTSENMCKYELMDGAPIKGENIPIRLFLEPLKLTPTYRSIASCASIKYYLNLVLIDEEDRRYFKQQEVVIYRAADE
jgi:vacuolar protein sorting-associated protein 26